MNFWTYKTGKNVTGPQNRFSWVWNLKNLKFGFQFLTIFENYLKFAHEISVQNGSDAFPNELMRF